MAKRNKLVRRVEAIRQTPPTALPRTRPWLGALISWVVVTQPITGCKGGVEIENPYGAWVELNDIAVAPPVVQYVADAVVLINTATGRGTGFFVEPNGLLMTNEHVLGAANCVREGCYIELTWRRHKGATNTEQRSVFAVPVYADRGLDVSLFRVYPDPEADTEAESGCEMGGEQSVLPNARCTAIAPPHSLTLSDQPPRDTVGASLYVVGHPLGQLKKWAFGYGHELLGDWLETTNFILPGNSGSPLLAADGSVVGLMHRSETGAESRLNDGGAVLASFGTTAQALREATGVGTASLRENTDLFVSAQAATSLTLLSSARRADPARATEAFEGETLACDDAIEAFEDNSSFPRACARALSWVDCPGNEDSPPRPPRFCPSTDQEEVWQLWQDWPERVDVINAKAIPAQGAPTALWMYHAVFPDPGEAQTKIDDALDTWLNEYDPVITLSLASTLLGYSDRKMALHTDLERLVLNYRNIPHFYFASSAVRRALFILRDREVIDDKRLLDELLFMLHFSQTPLSERLIIETILQNSNFYDDL